MGDYLISVIIPTYNAENYLMNAVNSVINQTFGFEKIELLLIDDCSTDNTRNIIKDLSLQYENIVPIFSDENSGSPSVPRNKGIELASADYIMFMDNDDSFALDICEVMYSNAINYDVDIVSCRNYNTINGSNSKFKSILDKKDNFVKLNSIDEDPQFLTTTSMFIWNKIYRKSFILENNVRFPSNALYEDNVFNIKAYIRAKGIVFLNDYYGYNYTIRDTGDSKSTSRDFKKETLIKNKNGLIIFFNILKEENKSYPSFEAEIQAGFIKWISFTNDTIDNKIATFNEVKPFYKNYSLFTRITFISIFFNIGINLGIKLFYHSEFFFRLFLKLCDLTFR